MYTKTKIKFSQDFKYVSVNLLNIEIIMDIPQFEKFNNDEIHWNLNKEISVYPYYKKTANIRETLLEYFYTKLYNISFKNNNKFDLRKENCELIIINDKNDKYIREKYNVIKYFIGHPKTNSENKLYNMSWLVYDFNKKNPIDTDFYYLMYCEKNVLIKLTLDEYEKLNKYNEEIKYNLTWFHSIRNKDVSPQSAIMSIHNKNNIFINSIINTFNKKKSIIYIKENEINTEINTTNDNTNDNTNDIFNNLHKIIENEYKIIKVIKGHIKSRGIKANIECNRIWIVKNKENKELYLMGCENDYIIKLCEKSYKIILEYEKTINKKITWHIHTNGYIQGRISDNYLLYIHQVITGCYGNGKGTMNISVDHIDRDPLNNCFDNLCVATREEQEINTKTSDGERRARSKSAKPLPDGITNDMMRKYVVYYKECYNKDKQLYREFFKIEKHPKLEKPWIGCKSNKISILDKLQQANNKINELDNN